MKATTTVISAPSITAHPQGQTSPQYARGSRTWNSLGYNRAVLTVKQAAAQLGISGRRVRWLILNGRLKADKHGGRDWILSEAAVKRYASIPRKPGKPRSLKVKAASLRRRASRDAERAAAI